MKAYEITEFGIDKLAMAERSMPEPGRGEVLIRFHAASLNYRDVMVVSGTYNPRLKMPAIPFSDAAGEIVEIGAGVTRFAAGGRVSPIVIQDWMYGEPTAEKAKTAMGAGARDVVLRVFGVYSEKSLVQAPGHLSFVAAATLPCACLTAWNALVVSGKVKAGDTVLTLGTGGVSIF